MGSTKAIGIFDSGVGGLSVAKEVFRQLPKENTIYFGDTLNIPYGPRTAEEIIKFSEDITKFLIKKDVKIIIIACNTSSSLSLSYLEERYKLAIFDVIYPSLDVALEKTENKKIGVLGTLATIKSQAHKRLLEEKDQDVQVIGKACPKIVPLVEEGIVEGEEVDAALDEYLEPLKAGSVDTLILACTHYPFVQESIQRKLGTETKLIDPALETVRKVKAYLEENDLLNDSSKEELTGQREYFVSKSPEEFLKTAELFLAKEIKEVKKINLEEFLDEETSSSK